MNEIELTCLAKYLPEGLEDCELVEIEDWYFPVEHPRLRLRRKGDKYTLVRKSKLKQGDASQHREEVIVLNKHHWEVLRKIEGEGLKKKRYLYMCKVGDFSSCPPSSSQGRNDGVVMAEIDVFEDDLAGLVLVDFEFDSVEEMTIFKKPDFCLVDVTQEDFIAGGNLSGKMYEDIEDELEKFGYEKLDL